MDKKVDFPQLYYYVNSILTIATNKHPEYYLTHLELVIVENEFTYRMDFQHATSGHRISLYIDIRKSINYNIRVIDSIIVQ